MEKIDEMMVKQTKQLAKLTKGTSIKNQLSTDRSLSSTQNSDLKAADDYEAMIKHVMLAGKRLNGSYSIRRSAQVIFMMAVYNKYRGIRSIQLCWWQILVRQVVSDNVGDKRVFLKNLAAWIT